MHGWLPPSVHSAGPQRNDWTVSERRLTMTTNRSRDRRDSTRIVLDPPTFSPPPDMRAGYLSRRQAEVDEMLDHGRNGEWKPVVNIANHVRGTGAMYGFKAVGDAAENLVRAITNGDAGSLALLEEYVKAVREAYV